MECGGKRVFERHAALDWMRALWFIFIQSGVAVLFRIATEDFATAVHISPEAACSVVSFWTVTVASTPSVLISNSPIGTLGTPLIVVLAYWT